MISLADVILTQTIGQTSSRRFTDDLGHPEARLDGAVLDDVPLNLGVVKIKSKSKLKGLWLTNEIKRATTNIEMSTNMEGL